MGTWIGLHTPARELAIRLLLKMKDMTKDLELSEFVTDPQVTHWMGPDAHACISPFLLK